MGHPQREAHQTHIRSLTRNPTSQKTVGPIFNILKEKNFQPRISYPAKLSFISEGEFFTDKQLLRGFVTTRPALQELLKETLSMERNKYCKSKPVGKDQKCNEENESTNEKENQPVTKWQDQIHT